MPLPRTTSIHPRFEAHLRPVTEGDMPCELAISRAGTGPGTFDPATGTTTGPARVTVAICPGRVTPTAAQSRTVAAAGQQVTLRTYLIAVPVDVTGVRVDDRVTVTAVATDADPGLLGAVLRVTDVTTGSTSLQRTLVAEQDLG